MLRVVLLLAVVYPAVGYNFLVVFPMPSGSHNILGKGIVKALTDAGHRVTHITPIPAKETNELVEQIDVSFMFDLINNPDLLSQNSTVISMSVVKEFSFTLSRGLVASEQVQRLMMDRSRHYDAVISEMFFTDTYAGFAQVFECPWLNFSPIGMLPSLEYHVDEVQSPALNPFFITGYTVPMSFHQRVINTFIVFYGLFDTIFIDQPREAVMYEEVFGAAARARGVSLPPYAEAVQNVSILLLNSHPTMGQTLRLPGNVVQIAGYHIDSDVTPLPKDLQETLDRATSGAVYFSMGSNLKSATIPKQIIRGLLALFAKLKMTVLWKFEAEMEDAPPNLHVAKWMPQQSILAHKNVKVFITHGGFLSLTEAMHFGVPLIAVPIFGDQFINAQTAEKQGFAIAVDYKSEDFIVQLEKALNKIISDKSYYEKVQALSKLYHDRPIPPARQVSYWAEHAVRTRGARHLRSPALIVPAYQRYLLDVAAAAIALIAALYLAIRLAIRRLIALFKRGETTKMQKKKNN